jgi:hypothetical protein
VINLRGQAVGRIGPENAAAYRPHLGGEIGTSQEMDAVALVNRGRDDGRLELYVALPREWKDNRAPQDET